ALAAQPAVAHPAAHVAFVEDEVVVGHLGRELRRGLDRYRLALSVGEDRRGVREAVGTAREAAGAVAVDEVQLRPAADEVAGALAHLAASLPERERARTGVFPSLGGGADRR